MATTGTEWLLPFVDRLSAAGRDVLELGCGPGADARFLAERGFRVVALDRIARAQEWHDSRVHYLRGDIRLPPVRPGRFDVVLASLSLHYLPWRETLAAFGEAGDRLRPGGLFLFRVNASDDVHHGAGQGDQIEPGFFQMPQHLRGGWDRRKRFFTEDDVRAALPSGFAIEHLAHRTIHRWEQPKQAWECLARLDG